MWYALQKNCRTCKIAKVSTKCLTLGLTIHFGQINTTSFTNVHTFVCIHYLQKVPHCPSMILNCLNFRPKTFYVNLINCIFFKVFLIYTMSCDFVLSIYPSCRTNVNYVFFTYQDAAWETLDDFERLCMEHICSHIRSVERKCSEMREQVGETEKAGLDWTSSRLAQLQREVSELRRRENQLSQISVMEDPVQFLQVMMRSYPLYTCSLWLYV